ncbi:MAG: isoleucine--tRNA ligase [Acidimicrobiia bacterium]
MSDRQVTSSPYPDVESRPSFPAIEGAVLEYWEQDGTFEASLEARPKTEDRSTEFVFYDGPPFANGLPHYGHLLTGFVKDAVPRYQTMRGRRVERRFGWDCHGLPAEMEAERQLGISGRQAVQSYGIDRFNEACRSSVLRYTQEWETYVRRQARWVDFKNDYKTLDLSYMESVMFAFKRLWERGLIYSGHKVLPYCWECETPLSNFETRLDDAYRARQDPALTVLFRLETGEQALVWTTTPWTLPSNLALAVHPEARYAVLENSGERYLIGCSRLGAYEPELAQARKVDELTGAELAGRSYAPLFPFFAGTPDAFRILPADFVTEEDGTGIVHIAPGFGEDDQRLCEEHGIPVVVPVDDQGRFSAEVPPYAGQQVFEANAPIIHDLKERHVVVRHETYVHEYPHCWRTDTPLIYRAVSSWFVAVTAIKQRALELNEEITWVPAHVKDGAFGSWLANARDWAISRNRFWGSPIPVWRSDDPRYPRIDVYGSLDELGRDFGVRPDELHRPAIDNLVRPNPDDPTGRAQMRRVPEVLDCWFESGSMPFAQVHYPFENVEWFENHFPADFIVEYVGQTRAWFYSLHVLATALFDRPAFGTCLVHGVILGNDGRKASKRLRNYTDPEEMFETYGADAVRWFLLSSAVVRGQDLSLARDRAQIAEAVRTVLNPVWQAWHFFALYANADGYRARPRTDSQNLLDRYVVAKTTELVELVTGQMDTYDLAGACGSIEAYLDALTNWYIRRSRARFWRGDPDAFDTLAHALETLCRVGAPLFPMVSEAVYRGLTEGRSVHMTSWPEAEPTADGRDLVSVMDRVRTVCSTASSIRKSRALRVRLPLRSLTVAAPDAPALEPFSQMIAEEANVKEVHLTARVEDVADFELRLVLEMLGPRLGPDVQKVIRAVRAGTWRREADTVVVLDRILHPDEFELIQRPRDEGDAKALPGGSGIVQLDTEVTPELLSEGLARDVVRLVNEARRQAGLEVSDRIRLTVTAPQDVARAVLDHTRYVNQETLAVDLRVVPGTVTGEFHFELPDGRAVGIAVERVDPS